MQVLTPHTVCRVCGGHLKDAINLGLQYLQGEYHRPTGPRTVSLQYPTALCACEKCTLLQMRYTVEPSILYSQYYYQSGTNATMRNHLGGIVDQVLSLYPTPGVVLDIGCNDGTLLGFYPPACFKVGIDPSNVAMREHARSVETTTRFNIVGEMFPSVTLIQLLGKRQCDIVTAIAMFYDLDDPVGFVRSVRDIISPTGILVLEVSHLPTMLKNNSYDTICAEHLEYYSYKNIEEILHHGGMKPFLAQLNDANGGSIRVFACKTECHAYTSANRVEAMRKLAANEPEPDYPAFTRAISEQRTDLLNLLTSLRTKGKSIHIYGASTKGNTILQYCGINSSLIEFAADRNYHKHGCRTLGSDILIISEEESRALDPDYYLVLPWHFEKEFRERERIMLRKGTKMIFPLPEVRLVGA